MKQKHYKNQPSSIKLPHDGNKVAALMESGRVDEIVAEYKRTILNRIDDEYNKNTKFSNKVADQIAQFGGSWKFINIFGIILFIWMLFNTLALTKSFHFDEPPFILLNLCLSFLAAFQAPIIMMSQNRQAARDKNESIVNFAINYRAEEEVDDMQGHLHRIEEDEIKRFEYLENELKTVKKLLLSIESEIKKSK
ncbi:DUF1003 domain-containing protein [Neobacillus ginsengisoli]|uniref:Membrane protein n=1 Tax=Neobacillus ginsengisoli TaxID=904295 RepID=A0ABT9Y1Q6_9BACI|nr:DUF1003 domain-containing protein [Neobacillus ginsengisoli]MDQ0201753.1 putative membrane protein [Neobacillus ginsengisoli]